MEADIEACSENGSENRRIERLIAMQKEEMRTFSVDSPEYLEKKKSIKVLNEEQQNLKKKKTKLEHMYSQGMYVKDAHSPETFDKKVEEFTSY